MPRGARRNARRRLPLLIINDISESRRDAPAIRGFLRSVYGKQGRLVGASKIRQRVFGYLGRQPKYDLIFLGATGGPRIFMGGELARMGKAVKEIPYSMHIEQARWPSTVLREAAKLGEKPRILLLDSDVGPLLHTANKLADAKRIIAVAKKDAVVHVVAGAASNSAKRLVDFDYIAYPTSEKPVRLSELMDNYATDTMVSRGKGVYAPWFQIPYGGRARGRVSGNRVSWGKGTQETKKADEFLGKLRELQKKRGMTGTLPH